MINVKVLFDRFSFNGFYEIKYFVLLNYDNVLVLIIGYG